MATGVSERRIDLKKAVADFKKTVIKDQKLKISHSRLYKLIVAFEETQTFLVQVVNDPTNPKNGELAADRFNKNKAVLKP
jgi:hypothetical protein